VQDSELEAMSAILRSLEPLDNAARRRVLTWAMDRLSIEEAGAAKRAPKPGVEAPSAEPNPLGLAQFASLGDAYTASGPPDTESRRALVVAAYLQEVEGCEITGFEINSRLKHLGFGVQNITLAMNSLINARPQLAIQVRKSGASKQARKLYRVTAEGLKEVEALLQGELKR